MGNTNLGKERVEFFIPPPITLNRNNLPTKETLYKRLKFMKFVNHFRLIFKQIDLCKFTIIIHKAYIILISSHRFGCRTPDIRKCKFKRLTRHASRLWIGMLVTLSMLTWTTNTIFI
jgi:hypothetical protein